MSYSIIYPIREVSSFEVVRVDKASRVLGKP
jgi:hypothetical protein